VWKTYCKTSCCCFVVQTAVAGEIHWYCHELQLSRMEKATALVRIGRSAASFVLLELIKNCCRGRGYYCCRRGLLRGSFRYCICVCVKKLLLRRFFSLLQKFFWLSWYVNYLNSHANYWKL
jgi:hypothetical protein